MALDHTIMEILDEQAAALNRTQTESEVRVSFSDDGDYGRFCYYDVKLFRKSAVLGEQVLRVSHESPGPSFPVNITSSKPDQPKHDIAGSPEVLAEKVRDILASASRY